MLTTAVVVAGLVYMIGLRADRIHAQRSHTSLGEREVSGQHHENYAGAMPEVILMDGSGVIHHPDGGSTPPAQDHGLYRGSSAATWAMRYRRRTRQYQDARRVLLSKPSVTEAISLACATYGNCSTLWALARCETGGTFSPGSYNRSGASGLFQFLPSTFASTPYRGLSIWSPHANAMAAGWMLAHGRRGEWVC